MGRPYFGPGLSTTKCEKMLNISASFKSTLHFLGDYPFSGIFSQKTVKYFWGHMKDANISTLSYKKYNTSVLSWA